MSVPRNSAACGTQSRCIVERPGTDCSVPSSSTRGASSSRAAGDEAVLEVGARLALGARRRRRARPGGAGARRRGATAPARPGPAPRPDRRPDRSPRRASCPIARCGRAVRPLAVGLTPLESSRLSQRRPASARGRRLATTLALFVLGALLSGLTIRWGINPHDEGLMLRGRAHRRGPAALPRLLRQLRARAVLPVARPRRAVRAVAAELADPARGARRRRRRAGLPLVRREAPEPLALAAWLAVVAGAMAFPSIPQPQPGGLALGLRGAAARRSGVPRPPARSAGVAAVFRWTRPGGRRRAMSPRWPATARRAARGGPRRAARRRRRRGRRGRAARARRARRARATAGTRRSASRSTSRACSACRCPAPGDGGFEPNKVLEHYFPYVLLGGAPLWLVVAAARPAAGRACGRAAPLALAGVGLPAGARRRVPPRPAGRGPAGAAGHRRRRARAAPAARSPTAAAWCRARPVALHGLDREAHPAARPAAAGAPRRRRGRRRQGARPAEARALSRARRATCARACPTGPSRCSWPTRATTSSGSATRSSTCWSGAPTRPATT